MKKSWIIFIVILILAGVAWYLISPAFKVVEVQEVSPFEDISPTQEAQPAPTKVKDALNTMDPATKEEFEKQTEEMKHKIKQMDDVMPPTPTILAQGEFKPRAHEVAGKAILIQVDQKRILRFEDFETINGPDLRIYLATDASDDDFVELGKIKATKGNVNYEIPNNIDTAKYNHVLVWCKPFSVLFSWSELS
jgi:hypothetical protein